jgi:hypothetical protein
VLGKTTKKSILTTNTAGNTRRNASEAQLALTAIAYVQTLLSVMANTSTSSAMSTIVEDVTRNVLPTNYVWMAHAPALTTTTPVELIVQRVQQIKTAWMAHAPALTTTTPVELIAQRVQQIKTAWMVLVLVLFPIQVAEPTVQHALEIRIA